MRKRTHARNALEQPRDDINERVGELEALNAKQVMTRQRSSFGCIYMVIFQRVSFFGTGRPRARFNLKC